jgi:Protein of unknown function (DUF1360)
MSTVAESVRQEADAYASEASDERPLGGYLAVGLAYAATVAAVSAVSWRRGARLPERVDPQDLVLIGVATHKLSRILSKAGVTSPLRAPFTRFRGRSGPAELLEDTRGTGVRKAVAELATCPFCLGQWVATGFAVGLVNAPRLTRVVASVFAALAVSDFLHLGYCTLEQTSE